MTDLSLLFVPAAGIVAHLLFSPYGFNPSDDGFILAGARRILDGQIPHRDFISIRTTLSHVLHALEIPLGGRRCLMVSRLVFWLEMAAIAWLWCRMLSPVVFLPAAIIAFCLSINTFPPMAWHTVDAILFSTIGISLLPSPFGYLVLGLAPLCRQNFLVLLPLVVVVEQDYHVLLALSPLFFYCLILLFAGGIRSLFDQVRTYGVRLAYVYGVLGFLNRACLVGVMVGLAIRFWPLAWLGPILAIAMALDILHKGRVDRAAFFIFGVCASTLTWPLDGIGVLLLGLAWVASLSVGFSYPALIMGALWVYTISRFPPAGWALWGAAATVAALTFWTRLWHLYRQPRRSELRFHLGEVLAGGGGIFTDEQTYTFFKDLNSAKTVAQQDGHAYCLIPDGAVEWILSEQPNPLSCDWPQDTELGNPLLLERVRQDIARHPNLRVIIQKVRAQWLAFPHKRRTERPGVERYVRASFQPVAETEFFAIFESAPVARASSGKDQSGQPG